MRRFFGRKKPIDPIEKTLFSGENSFPPSGAVAGWVVNLNPADRIRLPKCYVDRTEDHVISWISGFIETEERHLTERFSADLGRGYEVLIYLSDCGSKMIFRFMLKTIGLAGHTSYEITIQKYLDDGEAAYICVE